MKTSLIILVIFLLASCQTAAQKQATFIRENIEEIGRKTQDCFNKIETNPAYQSISMHLPLTGIPTLPQLSDNAVPTDDDIRVIIALYKELEPCHTKTIEDLMKITPGLVPSFVQAFHAHDLITVDLIQHKITYGEANKQYLTLYDEFAAKVQELCAQFNRELEDANERELAERQAALNALSQWAYQQQILMQNERLIKSSNQSGMIPHCTLAPDGSGNLSGYCR